MLHAFSPLYSDNPQILILGTFPSPLSREKGEYYGNPRNQFWRLIYGVFDRPFDNPGYEDKKSLLFLNHIALCDVVAKCEADGATDDTIRAESIEYKMTLPEFIAEHGIRKVFFNGNNAYLFYKRGIGKTERNVLPSSSPANARISFEEKLRLWRGGLLGGDT
jgi:hypoxanthine-DNA glycosylase